MSTTNHQATQWSSGFGELFTNRYYKTYQELEDSYHDMFNVTRTDLNKEIVGDLDRSIRVLEIGANSGLQLVGLQRLGFRHLFGIDVQRYAIEQSKKNTQYIDIIESSALHIPFQEKEFDLVFTSYVLIHIAPENLPRVMDEMYRCSKKYIWCAEYYADTLTEVKYQGETNMLWKQPFMKLFLERFPDLKVVREKMYSYRTEPELHDHMFLLEKTTT